MKSRHALLAANIIMATQAFAALPPPGDRDEPLFRNPPPGSVKAGTAAPDGIGVTVGPAPSLGDMSSGPWVEGTLMKPLLAGATIPEGLVVKTPANANYDLNAAIKRQPTVLIFYRGGWCPYCSAHLRELQGSMPALKQLGYQVLAVSHDPPAALKAAASGQPVDYVLLSDSASRAARKFGLVYKVKQEYLQHISRDRGADVSVTADNAGDELPTPAAYILDKSGKIRFAYVNKSFAVRISQAALLDAARAAVNN
jgi:peroxiredoxin